MADIFLYDDYKTYLNDWLGAQPKNGWGLKSMFANVAGCRKAFISQTLSGSNHFSLEQAVAIDESLGHSDLETQYFLLLIQEARSGTIKLKRFFFEQRNLIKRKRFDLKTRLNVSAFLEEELQSVYYSSWIYSAVHVLTGVKEYQRKETISQRLSVSLGRITEVLDFLVSAELVLRDDQVYRLSKKSIHLDQANDRVFKHHANWRLQAIRSLDSHNTQDLHYSSVVSISKEAFEKIKEILVSQIRNIKSEISASPEENIYGFSVDLFKV